MEAVLSGQRSLARGLDPRIFQLLLEDGVDLTLHVQAMAILLSMLRFGDAIKLQRFFSFVLA